MPASAPTPNLSGQYVTTESVNRVINEVTPPWLVRLNSDLVDWAKIFGSGFDATISRHYGARFLGSTRGLESKITITGPNTEKTAFDDIIRVPVGGFKYGDINPKTGELFKGGYIPSKKSSYIILEDKPVSEGEPPKVVSRTYSKFSGATLIKKGYMSESIRYNVGQQIFMSNRGRENLMNLATKLCIRFAQDIIEKVTIKARALGFEVSHDMLVIRTTDK